METKNLLDLPEELLMNVMSFLSYRDRDVLAKCGFNFKSINERKFKEFHLISPYFNVFPSNFRSEKSRGNFIDQRISKW